MALVAEEALRKLRQANSQDSASCRACGLGFRSWGVAAGFRIKALGLGL